jgi:hypothetical protein
MASMSGDDDDAARLGDLLAPPWQAAADEAPLPEASFPACDQVVEGLAKLGGGEIGGRTYSLSQRWGKILRAKWLTSEDAQSVMLLTCWGPDAGVQIVAAVSRDGKTPFEFQPPP